MGKKELEDDVTMGEKEATGELKENLENAEIEGGDLQREYPFPMATVVREMKKHLHGKMLSSKVKVAMNLFLADIVTKVAKEMDKTRYSMVEMDDFNRGVKPFLMSEELEEQKEIVSKQLDAIRSMVEGMIKELDRKFDIETL